jgi:ubiquinone/menaquinone biosynthesis C-methylase UbiE
MSASFGTGFHATPTGTVDASAYERFTGRWSRLFIPSVLADIAPGSRVLDVSTGTGEAASMALSIVGMSGFVVGADISPQMLRVATDRLHTPLFRPVAADGQALPFHDASFDSVVCQLGLQFFPDPARGLSEFRRVLRGNGNLVICVISTPDRAPMWGILADVISRYVPDALRRTLYLSFSLADPARLESLLASAGFRDIRVAREEREDVTESFDEYWEPIEAGIGSIPQSYLALSDADRRAVRNEVKARLSQFESNGKLLMRLETLIARARA